MTTVFLPVLREMRDLVVGRADPLREPDMPPLLLELCAHAAGYEITAARWARGDFSEHLSLVAFPSAELAAYARRGFGELKLEQARLLGAGTGGGRWPRWPNRPMRGVGQRGLPPAGATVTPHP